MAAEANGGEKRNKRSINEDDASVLLHRYTPTQVLTLLQEVSQHASAKINWKAIVNKTTTGITCAREYQMLWRHLAYRDALLEKIEAGAEPLDDESDLEFELEAVPAPNEEALLEATACVKVLINGIGAEAPTQRTGTEAPAGQKNPNDKISRVPSDKQIARCSRGTSTTGSGSDQKPSLQMGTSTEALDSSGNAKKKKKPWTKEEDMELTAAVRKYGEGNWMGMLRGDYKHDRTAIQLSQRWSAIRKRQGIVSQTNFKSTSLASSEERMAARKAFSMALDMPMNGGLSILKSAGQAFTQPSSALGQCIVPESKPAIVPQPIVHILQGPKVVLPQKLSNTSNKSKSTSKKQPILQNTSLGPNSSIQAAAIAAGGRIATSSTAADLIKAAQSKNVVHITSRGGGSKSGKKPKKSTTGMHGTQPVNAQHVGSAAESPTAGILAVLVKPRTEQVHSDSRVAGVNPLAESVAVDDSETEFNTTFGALNGKSDEDSDIDDEVVIVDDLFTEDPKDEMLEFDRYVAANARSSLLGKRKIDQITSRGQVVLGGQKDQLKPKEETSGKSNSVSTQMKAADDKSMDNVCVANQTADTKPRSGNGNDVTAPKEQNEVPK